MAGKLVLAVSGDRRLEPSLQGDLSPPSLEARFQERGFPEQGNRSFHFLKGSGWNIEASFESSSGPEPTQSQGERTQALPFNEGSDKEFLAIFNLPSCVKSAG